jgi:hypothetical protein
LREPLVWFATTLCGKIPFLQSHPLGPVWFVARTHPTKKLVMPNIFPHVWFITNYLAAFGLLVVFFIDSCQNFGNLWVAEFHAKKLANQFW